MDNKSLSHTRWKSSFMGYLKGKSTLMIYGRHLKLQSKWSKAFQAREYYVATVGNITEEAVRM